MSHNPWPADRVERRSTESLTPYARNARTHSEAQVAQLAESIKAFGWTIPVLVDENGELIAGHGRVLAAKLLGLPEVPAMVAAGWTEAQKRSYVLADNQLALNAGWDEDLLAAELTDLRGMGVDLGLVGFSGSELDALFGRGSPGRTDPDEVPEPPAAPVTQAGDVWLLGRHRLICGDSTDGATVAAVLAGTRPHLMVTDPPYGVMYDPGWRDRAGINKPCQNRALGKVENDDRADWAAAWALFPGDVVYIWHGALHAGEVERTLTETGFKVRSQIIWAKASLVMGRGDYHWQHEPCWYAVREGKKGHWAGDRKQATVWQIANMHRTQGNVDDGKTVHSTQKPVECMRRPIENNSKPGPAVYEPFSGSGTTIIAAEMTGRRCCAVELSPVYVDVAVRRWEAFTGIEATLEMTAHTFSETEAERRPAAA